MSQEVVVVTGVETSPFGKLPFQGPENADPKVIHWFSASEYGNYLPELWNYFKGLVLSDEFFQVNPLITALRAKGWPVITDTADGLAKNAGIWPLVEASGNMTRGKCLRCQTMMEFTREDFINLEYGDVFKCVKCGKARVRPDVTLHGEKVRHRRLIEDFVREADIVVFVGVDENDYDAVKWARLARKLVIVSNHEGPLTGTRSLIDPVEWANMGCPLQMEWESGRVFSPTDENSSNNP